MNDKIMTREALDIIKAAIKANGIHLGPITPVIEKIAGLKSTGYAFRDWENEYFICVDPNIPKAERDFVMAHELGHILLGHLSGSVSDKRSVEMEANIFASVLVAFNLVLKMVAAADSPAGTTESPENG